jgi:hypothetical protein
VFVVGLDVDGLSTFVGLELAAHFSEPTAQESFFAFKFFT